MTPDTFVWSGLVSLKNPSRFPERFLWIFSVQDHNSSELEIVVHSKSDTLQQQAAIVVDVSDRITAREVLWNLTNGGSHSANSDKPVRCVCRPTATDTNSSSKRAFAHQCDIV